MPSDQVMKKFGAGKLRSGNKRTGKLVTGRKQAIAIKMSEQKREGGGGKRGHKRGRYKTHGGR